MNNQQKFEQFRKKFEIFESRHTEYDFSRADYKGSKKKLLVICRKHGEFWQYPAAHLRGKGCPVCSSSKGELRIASLLESKGYALNESYFREQTFDGCKDRIALRYDFYIPSKNLLIEYNGIQHYYQTFDNHDLRIQRHHDWLKRKYAKKHGVRLLTIPFTEYENIDKVLAEAL